MVAVAPELDLDAPPLRNAPFLYRVQRRIEEYALLVRFDRPIGTWLLLWPALWGLWIAGSGKPHPKVLMIFVLGVFVMRAAGCVINDFADRNIDPHVRRTRDRPLAARRISPREALWLFAILIAIALYLVTRLDLFTIKLAFVGAALTISSSIDGAGNDVTCIDVTSIEGASLDGAVRLGRASGAGGMEGDALVP